MPHLYSVKSSREIPAFQSAEIAQQYADGLLSRLEADVFDSLVAQGLFASLVIQHVAMSHAVKSEHGHASTTLHSYLYLHCSAATLPALHQWVSRFLALRQPEIAVILGGVIASSETNAPGFSLSEEQGMLVIGSTLEDMRWTAAEHVAQHLFEEGQIASYQCLALD